MRIVIAGCGSIGRRHLKNLQALKVTDLVGVDPQEDRRREVHDLFKIPVCATLSEALASTTDAVFVTAPSAYHIPIALEAARAGCHLFIEKPLSHTLAGVDDLMREAEQRNLVVFVGSNWKFHPSFQMMKALLDKGTIGRVTSARCQFGQYLPDWHPWEDFRKGYSAMKNLGGGVLLDSHEFDYLTWFLGPVTQVACFAGHVSSLEVETEDTAEVILKFASGAIGGIHLDYTQRAYQRNFEFFGEEGTIRWDIRRRAVELFEGGREGRWTVFDEPAGYDVNTMYVEEARHFLDCLRGRAIPLTDLKQGRAALNLILAAKASSADYRMVDIV